MLKLFISVTSLALAAQPAPAPPQPAQQELPEAPAGLWRQAEDHFTFTTANFDVPRTPGVVRFTRSYEFSHRGEGLDTAIRYESPDGQVFATVYAYFPGLPDAGFVAFTTDWILHRQSATVEPLGQQSVAAGGRDGVAIRADYRNYRGNLASSAAFLKLDRWIVKVRVSGPEARRAEVEATMAALLAGLRFNGPLQPRLAVPFEFVDCRDAPPAPAHPLPESQEQVLGDGLTAVMDAAGEETIDRAGHHLDPLPSRIGRLWCRPVTFRIGEESRSILRIAPAASSGEPGLGGRTVLLAPVNDSGTAFEQVDNGHHHFVLLYHRVGQTAVLGTYDGPLSDSQLADIMSGADNEGGRFRASVQHLVNGGSNFQINVGAGPPQPHRN